ncbi:hypothetical protein BU16DRAFT_529849 [Lophium mytilinum]|uniref:Uncharacterized protein n=1 Tax=Lophium mytilinum TaxID=390894 RepID=A0A6A6QGZ1_9PEZI|nr:hypothetical protein BU16DRAFT_529849 [Lophium mytilinum]
MFRRLSGWIVATANRWTPLTTVAQYLAILNPWWSLPTKAQFLNVNNNYIVRAGLNDPMRGPDCSILRDDYVDNQPAAVPGGGVHIAVKIPCGHVYGDTCLRMMMNNLPMFFQWPLCTRRLFRPTVLQLIRLLVRDFLNWLYSARIFLWPWTLLDNMYRRFNSAYTWTHHHVLFWVPCWAWYIIHAIIHAYLWTVSPFFAATEALNFFTGIAQRHSYGQIELLFSLKFFINGATFHLPLIVSALGRSQAVLHGWSIATLLKSLSFELIYHVANVVYRLYELFYTGSATYNYFAVQPHEHTAYVVIVLLTILADKYSSLWTILYFCTGWEKSFLKSWQFPLPDPGFTDGVSGWKDMLIQQVVQFSIHWLRQ